MKHIKVFAFVLRSLSKIEHITKQDCMEHCSHIISALAKLVCWSVSCFLKECLQYVHGICFWPHCKSQFFAGKFLVVSLWLVCLSPYVPSGRPQTQAFYSILEMSYIMIRVFLYRHWSYRKQMQINENINSILIFHYGIYYRGEF